MAMDSSDAFETVVEAFEEAWRQGAPDIDAFVASHPGDDDLVRELSLIDLEYRIKRGEPVTVAAYASRLGEAGSRAAFLEEAAALETTLRRRGGARSLGNYTLLEKIGEGGMGTVYRARHRLLDRVVAVKILAPGLANDPEAVRRFEREARTTARLEHPAIVPARDFGVHEGTAYLVMPYVEGRDLGRIVRERGPLPVAEAVVHLRQAAVGLAHAHSLGVVHRDVKPGNLLLGADSRVHILDLGLARVSLADADDEHLTLAAQIIGTVDFMAPEQAVTPSRADARVDVYSLGATFWYLVTGRPLFSGETVFQRMLAHRQSPPPALRTAVPGTPRAVDALFRRMVAKEPRERFQSMDEVVTAIDRLSAPRASAWHRGAVVRAGGVAAAAACLLAWVASTVNPAGLRAPWSGSGLPSPRAGGESVRNSIGMELVWLPAGSFEMGSPLRLQADEPLHSVRITRPFAIGRTEVTQQQWHAVMGTRPWAGEPFVKEADGCAAVHVNWEEAVEFCDRLTKREALDATRQRYALPTEAQWEYACRAGTSTLWSFGDDASRLSGYAWWGGMKGDGPAAAEPYPHEVAGKKPNPWGLHDMHGNVNEWCRDWYASDYYRVSPPDDPPGPPTGERRVVRGGHWRLPEAQTRSSNRAQVRATDRWGDLGFRVVLETVPDPAAAAPAALSVKVPR